MESGVYHARLHSLSHRCAQYCLPCARFDTDPIIFLDAPVFSVMRVDLQPILAMPFDVLGTPGLGADIILRQNPAGSQDQREFRRHLFIGSKILGIDELALAAHEFIDVHDRRAFGGRVIAWPLQAAGLFQLGIADTVEGGCQRCDFVHDFRRMLVVHRITESCGQGDRDFPVRLPALGRHHLAYTRDTPFGIGESAVLFQERRSGQEHVRIFGSLVEEQILHHDAFHRRQRGGDVLRVRIRLHDIFAFAIQAHETAIHGGVKHVRNPQTRFGAQGDTPRLFKLAAHGAVRNMAVTW